MQTLSTFHYLVLVVSYKGQYIFIWTFVTICMMSTSMMSMMAMMSRYGLRPGMGTMPLAPGNPTAPAPSGKVGDIVLEQKPIKVTLGFEVVRLASPPTATQAPKATRR